MANYFDNNEIVEGDRRNTAFQTSVAIREAVTLALNNPQPIKYEVALDYIYDLSPEIYSQVIELLKHKNESEDVKYYKELAMAQSGSDNQINPVDLINVEIEKLEPIIEKATEKRSLNIKLARLIAAKEFFKERRLSEHKILQHDTYLATRPYFDKKIYDGDSYQDYKISKNKYLRLRLLHPDKAEAITGADLIYEQFDLLNDRVRFVQLQYKVWDTKTFYLSDKRLQEQVKKMNSHLCKGNYCAGNHGKNHSKKFRFPYCSGFIRPTDNKFSPNSKMISSGFHLPICEAIKQISLNKNLPYRDLKDKSLTHKIFEETFMSNKLGSRWMPISELNSFYKKLGLDFVNDTIRVHAQEVYITSEEEKQKSKGR